MEEINTRNHAIDCLKGLLAIFMILAHCIQFFGEESKPIQRFLCDYVNLTTFSGFLFCFGYVSYEAYFKKDFAYASKKMLKNAAKILVAFYVSEVSYYAFVDNKVFRLDFIYEILLMKRYAGWSEFLVSFAGIMVIGIVLFPVFKKINIRAFAVLAVISIAACFLPYEKQRIPQLAMLIGSDKFITYPVIQYMVYFAFGVLLCKKRWVFKMKIMAGSALASISVIWYYARKDILPMRFPPSWIFVLGAFWFVYLYYLLCSYLDTIKGTNDMVENVVRFLSTIGCNSLFYLLLSNILIFAFAGSAFSFRDYKYVIGFYLFLMLFITYLQRMIKNIRLT